MKKPAWGAGGPVSSTPAPAPGRRRAHYRDNARGTGFTKAHKGAAAFPTSHGAATVPRDAWRSRTLAVPRVLTVLTVLLLAWSTAWGQIPPLPVDILDAAEKTVGKALIYPNFVELQDAAGRPKGAIGVVMVEGRTRLFVVNADKSRTLVGWAEGRRLFDRKGVLIGYYKWTPIRSYVYDKDVKLIGQAQCLAYQGVCAAGVAGFLLGLL